jgi:ubiquinone biosynthesis protein
MASVLRVLQIIYVLTQHGLAQYAPGIIRRIPWLRQRLPSTELTKPERLKVVLESLGGSFIKLGQMLALQPDILPFEYCYALYSLLDRVHPIPSDQIEEVFREEVGQYPSDVFDTFDSKPIASGSIGQVHVASHNGTLFCAARKRQTFLRGKKPSYTATASGPPARLPYAASRQALTVTGTQSPVQ